MKELSIFKCGVILITIFIISCESTSEIIHHDYRPVPIRNSLLLVPGQIPLPKSIKGVQFFRENYQESPPILRLNSEDKLILRFDELTSLSGQFTISFTHCNKDWEPTELPQNWVYKSGNEHTILGGKLNRESRPNYFSYEYKFPNRAIGFLLSGNYIITISDHLTGIKLFSLPFFVTENVGRLTSSVNTLFSKGPLGAAMDEISGTYFYPDFIEFPQFNLSYKISQNRFWKNNISPLQSNFDTEGRTFFRLTDEQFFPSYLEFNTLDLRTLNLRNPQIFSYERTEIPERVILKNDYLFFSSDARSISEIGYGRPISESTSRIVNVEFRYETQGALSKNSDIYLIGDFNQWTISDQYKLTFNNKEQVYKVHVFIKQGIYNYNYAIVKNGTIDFLKNLESLTQKPQEYTSFVYYKDPQYFYDRLLKIEILNSR